MFTVSYDRAVEYAGQLAPSLDTPTKFINWAEDIAALIAFIYKADYDDVTRDIVEAAKEAQDREDE